MKIKFLLSASCVFAMMLTGCVSELELESRPEGAIPINLDGEISQVATRVNVQGFETGDGLGIYAVNYEDDNVTPGTLQNQGNQADHVKYVFDEANWKWTPVKPVYYKDAHTNVDLYAFYPYAEPSNVSAYNFEVQKDQGSGEKEGRLSGYEASDFLWGKAENIAPTESKIKVTLNHKMSGVQVVLAEGEGFDVAGDWDLLDKKVLVTNTTRKASINLATGEVTPIGGAQATGIVMCPQADGSFRAIVVPQTLEALTPLFNITIGGVAYGFKKSDAYTYVPGKLHTFTITINRKYPSGEYEFVLTDTQIDDWKEDINTHEGEARQYYCVHCNEPGTLGDLIKADKKNPDKIKHLKVSGKIHAGDFYYMKDSMSILQSVNLKECEITDCYQYDCYYESGDFKVLYLETQQTSEEITAKYPGMRLAYLSRTYLKNEIPESAYKGKRIVNFSFPETVSKINDSAFADCSWLSGSLIIPDGVTEIGPYAFYNCETISSLSLPIGLEKISDYAFYWCKSISGQLILPSSVMSIGNSAFVGCTNLSGSLILPQGLTYLGSDAFSECIGFIGDLNIPESLKKIESGAFFGCRGLNGRLILHDGLELSPGSFSQSGFRGELVLPANITEIPAECFSWVPFTSIAGFPDGLLGIGDYAFSNSAISGKIELPESLVSLGSGAFYNSNFISELSIPENLSIIKSQAFYQCFQLNKIVCKSINPPILQWGAFDGVSKDNFTVEVPANSVKKYQADSQWGEFKRISAYYDFSISRSKSRALSSGKSQTYILRAPSDYDWSIESKPEWINVTPSSGKGKATITITFAEMSDAEVGNIEVEKYDNWGNFQGITSYPGRAGEVVFKLDDLENQTVALGVEQYDYEYADGDVVELNKATKGRGVNLVFMGDCYDARDIADGTYIADIREAFKYFFAVEPYATYKDYFNVYAVFGESADSGLGTVNTIRDAKFGSQYFLDGISPDIDVCYEYASKVDSGMIPGQTLVVMIENTTEYGGICYMWGDGSAIAVCPKSADAYPYDFRGIVQHEACGHGFGKLADEYIYHNAFITTCNCLCCSHEMELSDYKDLGWYRNVELTGDVNQVGWSHLIFHPKYSAEVDVYEGAYFHSRGVYRSEPTSCMNNNIPYFSAISRQAIVERIMEYAGEEFTLEKFYAADNDDFGSMTRGVVSGMMSDPVYIGSQHAPVYMGDKPNFRK